MIQPVNTNAGTLINELFMCQVQVNFPDGNYTGWSELQFFALNNLVHKIFCQFLICIHVKTDYLQ